MLVRLADWCYRQPPPRRRHRGSPPWSASFAPRRRVRRGVPAGLPAARVGVAGASDTLQESFPQQAGDTVQIVLHSEARRHLARRCRPGPRQIFADVAATTHVVGVASPFADGGAAQISDGRHDGVRRRRPRQERQRVHPGAGQGARRTDPRRRRRHPAGRGRRPGRGAVPDRPGRLRGHRAHRRGHHPAGHLRLRGGDGPAAAHRPVRPRDRDGARRGAAARRRRPGLGARHRGDGRHRRRHRLRAAHRHPVPQQPRRGPGPATRDLRPRSRRPVAPSLFAGLTVVVSMLGILLMGQPAMTGFAFTVVLAVLVVMTASVTLLPALLGFAGRNIERLHVPFVSKNARTPTTPRAGTAGAGSSSAGPGSPRSVDSPSCWRWRHRSSASASASPTPRTTRRPPPPARPTTCSPTVSAPGFSAPMVLTVQGASGSDLLDRRRRGSAAELAEVDGVALVSPAVVNDAGDTAVLTVVPTTSPQDAATEDLVDTLRDDGHPGRHRRHRPHRRTSAGWWPRTSTPPGAPRTGCRSSSAACCWSRSCC